MEKREILNIVNTIVVDCLGPRAADHDYRHAFGVCLLVVLQSWFLTWTLGVAF